MPKPDPQEMMVAAVTGTVTMNGRSETIRAGETHARRGHQIVAENPHFWKPAVVRYDLEAAEEAPGRKRRSPRRTASSRK